MATLNTTKPELTAHVLRSYLNRYGFPAVDEQAVLREANEAYARYRTWQEVPFRLDARWLDTLLAKHTLREEYLSQTA